MSDLICRNTMMRCNTPGMCSPHGGCRETETVSSVWLEQLRSEFRAAVRGRDALKAECEGLRGLFLSAAHGLCLPVEDDAQQVVDAITALQVRNAELRKHAPSSEIIWCECGDGYPANSYGAGFMDANGGVCANCDAALGQGEQS